MERELHVYEMNDCEWMAAHSPLEAALGYAATVSHSIERCVADEMIDVKNGCPRELSKSELRTLKYHDDDEENTVRTFRQELDRRVAAGAQFPQYFASTEY